MYTFYAKINIKGKKSTVVLCSCISFMQKNKNVGGVLQYAYIFKDLRYRVLKDFPLHLFGMNAWINWQTPGPRHSQMRHRKIKQNKIECIEPFNDMLRSATATKNYQYHIRQYYIILHARYMPVTCPLRARLASLLSFASLRRFVLLLV